jgi:hypothetical protein
MPNQYQSRGENKTLKRRSSYALPLNLKIAGEAWETIRDYPIQASILNGGNKCIFFMNKMYC